MTVLTLHAERAPHPSLLAEAPEPQLARLLRHSPEHHVADPYLFTTSVHVPDHAVTWARHSHPEHELLWTDRGVVTMVTGGRQWTVTPGIGLWIPAGMEHEGSSRESTEIRTTYFAPESWTRTWDKPVAVRLVPAARELLIHLKNTRMSVQQRLRAQQVCVDMLELNDSLDLDVPIPEDQRLALLVEKVLGDPADDRSLEQWASLLNMTSRTLTRAFSAEVAMSFTQWRRLVRMRAALGALTDGDSVKYVARRVGYSTTSAFVTAFRKTVGCTPGEFTERITGQGRNRRAA
ncbi:AraC family transcriptional regulator [Leucobacter sp. 1207-22]|uniref:AraC family transcriptional regulator n=1 Tax=Leucobacter sp. 1207-22 TaxID=2604456 RepID=UPI00406481FA